MQSKFDMWKSNQCNSLYEQVCKEKFHDHINQCRKSIWQKSTPIHGKYWNGGKFFRKIWGKNETEGKFLNLIKSTYKSLTANVIVNGKKLNAFNLEIEQGKFVHS